LSLCDRIDLDFVNDRLTFSQQRIQSLLHLQVPARAVLCFFRDNRTKVFLELAEPSAVPIRCELVGQRRCFQYFASPIDRLYWVMG
jgi:hypothetical protein